MALCQKGYWRYSLIKICLLFDCTKADPSKEVVALGQTYFAVQTRKQEVLEERFGTLQNEEDKRLFLRREMAEHNKQLADAAKNAGVIQPWKYAVFQNHGYLRKIYKCQ